MTLTDDQETCQRAMKLRELMNAAIREMTPQERDRTMQIHLAQARGPAANAMLLRQMTNLLIRARQAQPTPEPNRDG